MVESVNKPEQRVLTITPPTPDVEMIYRLVHADLDAQEERLFRSLVADLCNRKG